MNDIQSGRVLVNWQVTALVMFVALFAWGSYLGTDLLVSVNLSLLAVVLWLAHEIWRWEPGASVEEPEQ